jgi:hypothetical protein
MTFHALARDNVRRFGQKMTVTTPVTVYTTPDEFPVVLHDLVMCNFSGSAVNVALRWNDGTSDYNLVDESLAANSRVNLPLEFLAMDPGDTLIVEVGTANVVDVTGVYTEQPPPGAPS